MSKSLKTIPLCQLQPSKVNVRKTDSIADVDTLAASIDAHGLLENLVVSPAGERNGEPRFDVTAGGRRYRALMLLAKRKKIPADHPVPCLVRKANGASPTELSLAENVERVPLHPADQFEAFAKLHAEGLSAEDIAARFGLTAALVVQRLKLAAVSPRLVAEYRKEEMTLEQLMAFAISDDQEAQNAYWFDLPYADRSAYGIRRHLTGAHVEGADRRARFIGAKAYEEAGGVIVRDLFDAEDEGYFVDVHLLDRLVGEKLDAFSSGIRGEGWKWVEIAVTPEQASTARFSRAAKAEVALNKKDEKRLAKLAARYDDLVAELEDNDASGSDELDRVSQELSALQAKQETWPDTEKARAGVLICLDHDGSIAVVRGLVRPEDRNPERGEVEAGADRARTRGPYSDALLLELSAQRTAVLREVLADRPEQALTALLECLVRAVFFESISRESLDIGIHIADLDRASKSVGESKAVEAFRARHNAWQARLSDVEDVLEFVEALSSPERMSLLAHCVGASVNLLWHRDDFQSLVAAADRLVQRLDFDMADWWRPSVANFFRFISRDQIFQTVLEGVSRFEATRICGLKKAEMAERAQTLFARTRWLPKPLQPRERDIEMQDGDRRLSD